MNVCFLKATVSRIDRHSIRCPAFVVLEASADTLTADRIAASLQDGFRWSYQLLSGEERLLINRLAVFPETWTLEAAEGVCDGEGIDRLLIMDVLSSLVRKSLVTVERADNVRADYRF
jgi:predicted ATPase